MTVLVGVLCSDGAVIGADSVATSSTVAHPLIQIRSDDKIRIIGGKVIIAGTGSVGLSQRFHAVVQKAWDQKSFQKSCNDCSKELSAATVQDFASTGTPRHQQLGYGFGAMMAAPMTDKAELVEFGIQDFQPEKKSQNIHFVSMGSGQILADPFLAFVSRVLWGSQQPDVKTAMFGVYWALNHAIEIAPGGVGKPINIAVLRKVKGQWDARLLQEDELQEQLQHISEIEKRIASYPVDVLKESPTSPLPTPPRYPSA